MARLMLILFKGVIAFIHRLMNLATERLKIIFSRSAYYFENQTGCKGVPFPAILLVRSHMYILLFMYLFKVTYL